MRLVAVAWLLAQFAGLACAELQENIRSTYYSAEHRAGTMLLATLNHYSPIRQNSQIFHAYTGWNI